MLKSLGKMTEDMRRDLDGLRNEKAEVREMLSVSGTVVNNNRKHPRISDYKEIMKKSLPGLKVTFSKNNYSPMILNQLAKYFVKLYHPA